MMRTALFPGSFDPFTLGHMDILRSALTMFDRVIVAVGYNSAKSGFFHPDLRVQIIQDAVAGMENVEVCSYRGLTVDFCKEMGVSCIIRGLRTTTDFEMESVIAQANRKMAPDILSIFIPAGHEYSFISSTVVRDVLNNGGNARCFLPKNVDIDKYLQLREQ
ncbi:MAG: pantetheine-phosphate adenylyltransferase [Bacteroidales bacterium]|nr:pantetheine-phosphate adenylyltransferase [Bacteroidales bacterium]MBR3064158.1 pantetheine-phosphate adenylyltransferase [Bacteroidales bacterium]